MPDNKNPGPGAYQNLDPEAMGQNEEDAFVFPRGERPVPFVGKPDFDGRAFYKQKQGSAKHYMKGFTFKDSACHISEDPSKKTFPGPAFYNEQRA